MCVQALVATSSRLGVNHACHSPGAVYLGLVLWFVGSLREDLPLSWASPHGLGGLD